MDAGQLIDLIVVNGYMGQNSRAIQQQLNELRPHPEFVALTAALVSSAEAPVDLATVSPAAAQAGWSFIRNSAALLLKTCITPQAAPAAQQSAAGAVITTLDDPSADRFTVSACGMVIARLTGINGVGWWLEHSLDLCELLLNTMLPDGSNGGARGVAALLTLQYLVEDAARHLGTAVEDIVLRVCSAVTESPEPRVREKALAVLSAMYEFGLELDWRVELYSPEQRGLLNGSSQVAAVFTALVTDQTLHPDVRAVVWRIGHLLSDYLESIFKANGPDATMQMFQVWADQALEEISDGGGQNPDVSAVVVDFLAAVYGRWAATEGEETVHQLVTTLNHSLPEFVRRLLFCVMLSDAELNEIIETDGLDHREPRMGKSKRNKKNRDDVRSAQQGRSESEECAEATLRNSSLIALDKMAQVEPKIVADTVVASVQHVFDGEVDWRQLELGVMALGTIMEASQQQLIPYLPTLLPIIGRFIGSGEPDEAHPVPVISASLYAFQRAVPWCYMNHPELFGNCLSCALQCMGSSSRQVQLAAVSFLRESANVANTAQSIDSLAPHMETVMQHLFNCLPLYHTNNLVVLSEAVLSLTPWLAQQMGDEGLIAHFIRPLKAMTDERLAALQQSMGARYGDGTTAINYQQEVDADCFDTACIYTTALAYLQDATPVADIINGDVQQWAAVLQYALSCGAQEDDMVLIAMPLSCIRQLLVSMSSDALAEFTMTNEAEFVRLIVSLAKDVEYDDLRDTTCNILYELLERVGVQIVPSPDFIVELLASFGTMEENPTSVSVGALVLTKLFELAEPTQSMLRYAAVLSRQVRGDALSNFEMELLASCVGTLMEVAPSHFDLSAAECVALALRSYENDVYKARSTTGIAAVIGGFAGSGSGDPAVLAAAFTAYLRLVVSWAGQDLHHEGIRAGIVETITAAQSHPVLAQVFDRLTPDDGFSASAVKYLRKICG